MLVYTAFIANGSARRIHRARSPPCRHRRSTANQDAFVAVLGSTPRIVVRKPDGISHQLPARCRGLRPAARTVRDGQHGAASSSATPSSTAVDSAVFVVIAFAGVMPVLPADHRSVCDQDGGHGREPSARACRTHGGPDDHERLNRRGTASSRSTAASSDISSIVIALLSSLAVSIVTRWNGLVRFGSCGEQKFSARDRTHRTVLPPHPVALHPTTNIWFSIARAFNNVCQASSRTSGHRAGTNRISAPWRTRNRVNSGKRRS